MPSTSINEGTPQGYQQLSVTTGTAVALTPPASSNTAIISLETQSDAYWRDDGTAPTTTVGNRLYAGNSVKLTNDKAITQFKIIATDATVNVNINYYHKD